MTELRTALRNIHTDPFWWRKVLLGGALSLTVFGATWPAGLVVESMENVRKGFPTPLPPSIDPWTRCVIGLFALTIDFFFFVLPILIGAVVLFCGLAVFVVGQNASEHSPIALGILGLIGSYLFVMFALGVAPVGRLRYVASGNIEDALTIATLRSAFNRHQRGSFFRARIRSLPAYLPFVVFAGLTWLAATNHLAVLNLLALLLLWLTMSALVYAQLVVAQLYGAASRTF